MHHVFSVSKTLLRLRGKYPFSSTNPEGTAILTVKGEYSLYDSVWSEVSSAAKELIEMLLETDPI